LGLSGVNVSVKAKFHYASWFGAGSEPVRSSFEAGSELVRSLFGASSEPASVMEFGFYSADVASKISQVVWGNPAAQGRIMAYALWVGKRLGPTTSKGAYEKWLQNILNIR